MNTQNISLYSEATPNPESIKFVVNQDIAQGRSVDFDNPRDALNSPLASGLFQFNFVKGVYISQNFVTVTKNPDSLWADLIPILKAYIKEHLEQGNKVFKEETAETSSVHINENDSDAVKKIKEVLIHNVKPVVEMDGGNIEYRSFEDGVLTVALKGSCSGCPSSTITLKAGIENLLKRIVPEVQEVVAESE